MPSFAALPAKTRWELVEAVKTLTVYKDEDEGIEIHFFKDRPPTKSIDPGKPIEASPEVIAKGKGAFLKLDCNKCHGLTGDASGPSASDLKDDWGEPMWPRNFQEGHYRGVKSIRNIVERLNTGLSGTPMAAFGSGQLTDEEKWAIGHFLSSVKTGVPLPQPAKDGVLVASKKDGVVPVDLKQTRFWMDTPVYEVSLEGDGPKTARVAVQRDGKNILFAVSWDDAIVKGDQPFSPDEFLDGVTVELSANGKTNTWTWSGEAQKGGQAFDEKGAGPSKLEGVAKWNEGEWHVLFARPIAGEGDRIPLEGMLADLKIKIDDRTAQGAHHAASGNLKLGVP